MENRTRNNGSNSRVAEVAKTLDIQQEIQAPASLAAVFAKHSLQFQ